MYRFTQPDTLIPDLTNPQAWNRYSYVENRPIIFNDPTGQTSACGFSYSDPDCPEEDESSPPPSSAPSIPPDPTSSVTPPVDEQNVFNMYMVGWENFGTAWSIYWNPEASFLEQSLTGAYIGLWGGAHIAFVIGIAGLACAVTGPGCVAAVEGFLGIGGLVSADGDPTNEIVILGRFPDYLQAAKEIGGKTFNVPSTTWNALSKAEQWALNQQFLNNAITNGNTFYLASKWSKAVTGTFYRMELDYLFSQGYTLSLYQNYLIPPITTLP